MSYKNCIVVGASGAIGSAFVNQLASLADCESIYALSRKPQCYANPKVEALVVDYENEASIKAAVETATGKGKLDLIIVATGVLHTSEYSPERSLRELSFEQFRSQFEVNAILPAMLAKHLLPHLHSHQRSIFAVLSARVGSVSDNRLGGWYSYRASKAALNMFVKTAAIEVSRLKPSAIVVGLHPGTVDSPLSQPFQKRVPTGKLFTPAYSVSKMIQVLEGLKQSDSGQCFAWDGQVIEP